MNLYEHERSYDEVFLVSCSIGHLQLHSEDVQEMCKDMNSKWPALTMDILNDIFGAHKALIFGRLQRQDFTRKQFMEQLKKAEEKTFKEAICSPSVSGQKHLFSLSFYPEYIINDDIFEVMAFHFAVSLVVRSKSKKLNDAQELRICSVVIPEAICSRYDADIRYQPTITTIDQLAELSTSEGGVHVHHTFELKI